ncbi:hypothetical protein STANM309S_01476 [Streptomyces tanashiensis]
MRPPTRPRRHRPREPKRTGGGRTDRWRLLLGRHKERLTGDARRYAHALDELYGRGRGERRAGPGRRRARSGRWSGPVLPHRPGVGAGAGGPLRHRRARGGPRGGRRRGSRRRARAARSGGGTPVGGAAQFGAVPGRWHARGPTGPAASAGEAARRRARPGTGHPPAPGALRSVDPAPHAPPRRAPRPRPYPPGQPRAHPSHAGRPARRRAGAPGVQHPGEQGGGLAARPRRRRLRFHGGLGDLVGADGRGPGRGFRPCPRTSWPSPPR